MPGLLGVLGDVDFHADAEHRSCAGCQINNVKYAHPTTQAEFDAEQDYLRTLSYLSEEEQRKYRERQSVSFMYQKPPGLDAALSKEAAQVHARQDSWPGGCSA